MNPFDIHLGLYLPNEVKIIFTWICAGCGD